MDLVICIYNCGYIDIVSFFSIFFLNDQYNIVKSIKKYNKKNIIIVAREGALNR